MQETQAGNHIKGNMNNLHKTARSTRQALKKQHSHSRLTEKQESSNTYRKKKKGCRKKHSRVTASEETLIPYTRQKNDAPHADMKKHTHSRLTQTQQSGKYMYKTPRNSHKQVTASKGTQIPDTRQKTHTHSRLPQQQKRRKCVHNPIRNSPQAGNLIKGNTNN